MEVVTGATASDTDNFADYLEKQVPAIYITMDDLQQTDRPWLFQTPCDSSETVLVSDSKLIPTSVICLSVFKNFS